ncbi:MAG: PD40 domain-containing protein [Pirellulales bacterium]|nr:PD40 domain-containing protein [Pirellulales bacterium]
MKCRRVLVGGVLVACGLAVGWEVRAEDKAQVAQAAAAPAVPAAKEAATAKEAAAVKGDAAQEEPVVISPLRGAWKIMEMVTGGESTPSDKLERMKLIFGNTTFRVRNGPRSFAKMDYKIDSTAKPAKIDITINDETSLGIYAYVKGQLVIVWNESGKPRPASIAKKSDGRLVLDPVGNVIEVMDLKTGKAQVLIDDLLYTNLGSPEWSPDGRRLVCYGWRAGRGEKSSQAYVLMCDADGKNFKSLGRGTMPSWSPDGKMIAYSRQGVWIMNPDGTDRAMIERNGFAPEWAPKGKKIAYLYHGNVYVRDLDSGETTTLLDPPYKSNHFGMNWSPDGKWICFKGMRGDEDYDLTLVHVEGQKKGFRKLLSYDSSKPDQTDFGKNYPWTKDGKQMLVSLLPPGEKHMQLYLFDVEGKAKPKRLDWQRNDCLYQSPDWSPDFSKIVYLRDRTTPE